MQVNNISSGKNSQSTPRSVQILVGGTMACGMAAGISKNYIEAQNAPQDVKQSYLNDLLCPISVGFTLYLCWAISHIRKILKK